MRRPILAAFALLVATAAIGLASAVSAQTLKQRPAAAPATSEPSTPAHGAPAEAMHADEKPMLPKGTSFQVEIPRNYPMKAGEPIEAELIHPIYAEGKLAVPANTRLHGKVVALEAAKRTRWRGRLRGDFTPFHKAEVRFDELMLPSGPLTISAPMATDGAPVLELSAAGASPKRALIRRVLAQMKSSIHDRIAFFTEPGLGDRALQVLYDQLPYHPERIEAHTAWSFELAAPLSLPEFAQDPPEASLTPTKAMKPETWLIHAELSSGVTSATAKRGDPVKALVVEPVFDRNRTLVVPEGSTLIGKVTTAKAARTLGRNGKLRFSFQEVRFPAGANRPVEGSLAGATTEKTQDLKLDAEGTVSPRNKASAVAPILLTVLAGRALDQDGSMVVHTGEASNGFGFAGRIVGLAAGNYNVAAAIGFYAAGLSFYDNFLHSGRDVVFPKDTRIEIATTPLRAPVLKP
jgi:hypothetical protein